MYIYPTSWLLTIKRPCATPALSPYFPPQFALQIIFLYHHPAKKSKGKRTKTCMAYTSWF